MKRDVFFYRCPSDETVEVIVYMDKEEFNRTVEGYKYLMEQRVLPGDDITCLTLVKEILHAAEEGCQEGD